MTSIRYPRSVTAAMHVGLGLTLVALLVLYIDHATKNMLAGHIQAGYPSYSTGHINSAALAYLVYLSVLGGLGILSWLYTIWAARRRKPWARWLATSLFVLATSIGLFNLLVKDTSGDTGLTPLLGWIGLLPCLAGLVAVILMWRKHPDQTPDRTSLVSDRTRA